MTDTALGATFQPEFQPEFQNWQAPAHDFGDGPPAAEVLTPDEVALVRASAAVVEPMATEMAEYFYAVLFARYPQVRDLFPVEMDVQRDRLLRGLLRIVDLVDDPENLVGLCARLGRDHRKFGAVTAHYPAVGDCLLEALARFAGPAWSDATADAWARAYSTVARVMSQAAEDDALRGPAVWPAEIVHHVHRGHGIAEITVRPHSPYPYRAGQYVSMETPWQPRAWRYYSPCHAPRTDTTLTFHVRAVNGGAVSTGLVHHSRLGDVVHLGPAQGEMVLDPDGTRDIVCVAGGTGLAPIRALVEQAARNGSHRYVDVFLGARTGEELYGMDDMLRMAQRHHWLSVRAAVSHQRIPGREGLLPDVLREFGPWYQHEAFLCGPVPMVRAATQALMDHGMPRHRIRYDPLEGVPALEAPLATAPEEDERF
ncbi:globin domain-containing protein [Streptomyces montanisoli]|uniref:nitric oxide dioxygenase n=1 Tax=Streptomyces montanisoli TaxID=2798581 RepID=A0A940M950_9ACTN|nr:globin domain-containing protein [Streptomyces montanisoli]MBP0458565.1 flavohemoprotein [Streptomyces montanisoli]